MEDENWEPLRFLTPSTTLPNNSLVRLLPNNTVEADAKLYTSSLPLVHLNSTTEPVMVREYLCGRYVSRILNGQPIRFRWLQRYRTNPGAGIATWYLDDIRIRLWKGGCLRRILTEDFNAGSLQSRIPGIRFGINSGRISQSPSCNEPQVSGDSGSVLYFKDQPFGEVIFRRSLVIVLSTQNVGSCDDIEDISGEFYIYLNSGLSVTKDMDADLNVLIRGGSLISGVHS